MRNDIVKSLESLAAEKQSLADQERRLITALNRVLPQIGYQVVQSGSPSRTPARRAAAGAGGPKELVCPHCDRRFAKPLHLGRHMSVAHKGAKAMAAKAGASERKPRGAKRAATKAAHKAVKTSKGRARRRPAKAKAAARPAVEKSAKAGAEKAA